jgi:hypothetical protein
MKDFFKKTYWRITAVIGIFSSPLIALGAGDGCDTTGGLFPNPLSTCDLSTLIESFAQYAAQIGATVAVVMIIYSGYKFVAAQGKPAELEKAKDMFKWTVVGTAILLGAWVIATAVQELITGLG